MRTLTFLGDMVGVPPITQRAWNGWEFGTDPDVDPSTLFYDNAQQYNLSQLGAFLTATYGVPYLHTGYFAIQDPNSQRSLVMLSVIDANGFYTALGDLNIYDIGGNFVGTALQGTRTLDTDWGCYQINSATMGGTIIIDARFMGYAGSGFGWNYDLSGGIANMITIFKDLYGADANVIQLTPTIYKFVNIKAPPLGSQFEWVGNITNVLGSSTPC